MGVRDFDIAEDVFRARPRAVLGAFPTPFRRHNSAFDTTKGHAMPGSGSELPPALKTGIESLSGMSMDDVHVHYNSPKPAQLNALACAQGTDIHVAPGQDRHLAHEAWHIVQQRQGRVGDNQRTHIGLSKDERTLEVQRDLLAKRTPR
jgi:hypothetical protein